MIHLITYPSITSNQVDLWERFHAELIELSDYPIMDFGLAPSAIYGPLPADNNNNNNNNNNNR